MSKALRLNLIAFAGSVILFAAVLYLLSRKQGGLDAIIGVWRRTDFWAFAAAVLLSLIVQAISAMRLKIITRADALHSIKYVSILRIQFVSQFIAYVAPISALSDLAKAAMLRLRFDVSLARSIRLVLYERICGGLGAAVIGLGATLYQLLLPLPASVLKLEFAVWTAGLLTGAAILLAGELKLSSGVLVVDRITNAIAALSAILRQPSLTGKLLGVSFLQLAGFSAVFIILAEGMHISIPASYVTLFMPFIFLVSSLPIFYQGWGGREAAVILTIGAIDAVSTAQAVALSVAVGVVFVLSSFPGAVFWIMRPSMRKKVRREVEQTREQPVS
jgi:hypothetical protein